MTALVLLAAAAAAAPYAGAYALGRLAADVDARLVALDDDAPTEAL